MDGLVIASSAIPPLGLGLLQVQDDGSPTALVPFALIAFASVAVMLAVRGARDPSAIAPPEPLWPRSRWGAWAYVAGLFSLPATLLAAAAVSILHEQWLPAAVLLAMTITPVLLRVTHLTTTRRARRQSR